MFEICFDGFVLMCGVFFDFVWCVFVECDLFFGIVGFVGEFDG